MILVSVSEFPEEVEREFPSPDLSRAQRQVRSKSTEERE
jgi:hypothetical protein